MITVYVLVTFYDENGIHEKNSICQVKEENFDPKYMKKLEAPTADAYTKEETNALLEGKQDDLTAGTNITITDDVISATDTGDTVSVTQVQTTGTKIATVTVNSVGTDIYAPAGGGSMDTTIIADEFDTEPVIVPSVYAQYDIVAYNISNYYYSKQNSNSDEPGQSSKWQSSSMMQLDQWGSSIPAHGCAVSSDKYYINTTASSAWVNPNESLPSGVVMGTYKGEWSSGTSAYHQYAVGDYCIYEDELYRCNTATTGENWVAASWTQTQVMNELDTDAVPSLSFNKVTDVLETGDLSTAITGTLSLGPVDLNINSKTIRATIIEFASGSMRLVYVSSDVTQLNAVDLQVAATPGGSAWEVTSIYACQLEVI